MPQPTRSLALVARKRGNEQKLPARYLNPDETHFSRWHPDELERFGSRGTSRSFTLFSPIAQLRPPTAHLTKHSDLQRRSRIWDESSLRPKTTGGMPVDPAANGSGFQKAVAVPRLSSFETHVIARHLRRSRHCAPKYLGKSTGAQVLILDDISPAAVSPFGAEIDDAFFQVQEAPSKDRAMKSEALQLKRPGLGMVFFPQVMAASVPTSKGQKSLTRAVHHRPNKGASGGDSVANFTAPQFASFPADGSIHDHAGYAEWLTRGEALFRSS